ncbi:MAG: Lrp/AsnC family transcriptional regulator [Thermoplasmataceae archaeon]
MKPYKIDTLDLNIIEMLEEDCSLTYNEIAEKTGKTLWTVRDRMVLLRKRGIIRGCRADIDYSKLGYGCRALIGFNVPADKIDAIVSFVKTQKRIKRLIVTTGQRRFMIDIIGTGCAEIREYARKVLPDYGIYDVDLEVVLDQVP